MKKGEVMRFSGFRFFKNRSLFLYYLLAALLVVSAAVVTTNHTTSVKDETAVRPSWSMPDLWLQPVADAPAGAVVPDTISGNVCCDMAAEKKEDMPSLLEILIKLLLRLFS